MIMINSDNDNDNDEQSRFNDDYEVIIDVKMICFIIIL